jgi:two-component system, LytTR family, response regulator LytT
MKIKSIIIEDELPNAKRLEKLLQESVFSVEVIAKLQTIKDAVDWFKNNEAPSLIFMDIRLTDGLSFEIYKKVNIESPVIFTTAYDEYALQAFKINSIDYLLKPIDKDELERSLNKFTKHHIKPDHLSLMGLVNRIQLQQTVYRTRYLINYRDILIPVTTDEIAYFGSEFKNTYFVTHKGGKHFIDQTMEQVENEINPAVFFRISRQYIVCQKSINKIHTYFNGRLKLDLTPSCAEEIIVSREKSNALKEWLNK